METPEFIHEQMRAKYEEATGIFWIGDKNPTEELWAQAFTEGARMVSTMLMLYSGQVGGQDDN